jgi:hypothetical protein
MLRANPVYGEQHAVVSCIVRVSEILFISIYSDMFLPRSRVNTFTFIIVYIYFIIIIYFYYYLLYVLFYYILLY